MSLPRRLTVVAGAAALVAAVAGCGSSSDSSASGGGGSSAAGGGNAITIENFSFKPNDLSVKVGTQLSVSNKDSSPHTFTADDKSFDTGNLSKGDTKMVTLSKAGTVKYHCSIHNYMTGSLTVTG